MLGLDGEERDEDPPTTREESGGPTEGGGGHQGKVDPCSVVSSFEGRDDRTTRSRNFDHKGIGPLCKWNNLRGLKLTFS